MNEIPILKWIFANQIDIMTHEIPEFQLMKSNDQNPHIISRIIRHETGLPMATMTM